MYVKIRGLAKKLKEVPEGINNVPRDFHLLSGSFIQILQTTR